MPQRMRIMKKNGATLYGGICFLSMTAACLYRQISYLYCDYFPRGRMDHLDGVLRETVEAARYGAIYAPTVPDSLLDVVTYDLRAGSRDRSTRRWRRRPLAAVRCRTSSNVIGRKAIPHELTRVQEASHRSLHGEAGTPVRPADAGAPPAGRETRVQA